MDEIINDNDRRYYSRLGTDIHACIFCDGLDREIPGKLINICEQGLGVEFDKFEDYQKFLIKGSKIRILFLDSFQFGKDVESDVLNIKCMIRHVKEEGEKVFLGCYVNASDYEEYVKHREVSRYYCKTAAPERKDNDIM